MVVLLLSVLSLPHLIRQSATFRLKWPALCGLLALLLSVTPASANLPKPTGVSASTTFPAAKAANGDPLRWFTVGWNSASGSQDGFIIQARLGTQGSFVTVFSVGPNETEGSFALNGNVIGVGARVQFRVYSIKGNPNAPQARSAGSDIVSVVIPPDSFGAPTNLTATPLDNGVIRIQWQDNSTTEEYFAVELKTPEDSNFRHLGSLLFNKTEVDITGFDTPNVSREFRVRAWRGSLPAVGAGSSANGTAYSNVASAITKNLFYNEETDQFGSPYDQKWLGVVEKSTPWRDSYSIIIGTTGEEARNSLTAVNLPPGLTFNATSGELSGTPTQIGNFTTTFSANFTAAASINGTLLLRVLPPRVTSRHFEPATVGAPFSFTFNATSLSALASANLTGTIPPGLSYHSSNRTLAGTPTTPGVYNMKFEPTFTSYNGSVSSNFTVRVRPPNDSSPALTQTFSNQQLAVGGTAGIDLKGFFADPDALAAVRLETTSGPLDMLLYPDSAPQTVASFLRYVDAKDYDGTVFHRLVPGFVLQGGGFYPVAPPNRFFSVVARPSPINEPGVSNLRGTIAMAKIGGQPNSATTNFFFNLDDNSENLDNQNEGFTVFGRLAEPSLATLDVLAAKPRYNIPVAFGTGGNQNMTDWPFNETMAPPVAMNQAKLLKINTARRIEPLEYELVANSAPGVLEVLLEGSLLNLRGLAAGNSTVELEVTDRDGNSINHTFTVSVSGSANQFLAGSTARLTSDLPETPGWSWQWEKDGRPLRGATNFHLDFPAIMLRDAGTYRLIGTDPAGNPTASSSIAVGVLDFPSTAQNVRAGETVNLTAKFAGPGFSLRWSKDGVPLVDEPAKISGTATGRLRVSNFQPADSGVYRAELVPPFEAAHNSHVLGLSAARQVTAITQRPVLRPPFIPSAPVRQDFSLTLSWDEAESTRPTAVTVSGLPPGLTWDPLTRTISGMPLRSGSYTIRVISRNEAGATTPVLIPLTIAATNSAVLGQFQALVPRDAELNQSLGGLLALTTTKDGAYSGFLRLGARTERFRGLLEVQAGAPQQFSNILPQENGPALTLSGNLSNSLMNATLTRGNQTWNLGGFRAIQPNALQAVRYHTRVVLAEGEPLADQLPEGEGYFVVDVASTGSARITGALPDGTLLTASAPFLQGARFLWQQNLRPGGALLGNATTATLFLPARSTFNGTLNWSRQDSKPGFHPQSFAPQNFLWIGRRFVQPDFQDYRPLDLVSGQTSQSLSFLGSEVENSTPVPDIPISWSPQNRFVIPPNAHGLKLNLNFNTGLFSGTFSVQDGTAPNVLTRRGQYRGLWIPNLGGRGFFLLPTLAEPKVRASGVIELDPGPTPTPSPTP